MIVIAVEGERCVWRVVGEGTESVYCISIQAKKKVKNASILSARKKAGVKEEKKNAGLFAD